MSVLNVKSKDGVDCYISKDQKYTVHNYRCRNNCITFYGESVRRIEFLEDDFQDIINFLGVKPLFGCQLYEPRVEVKLPEESVVSKEDKTTVLRIASKKEGNNFHVRKDIEMTFNFLNHSIKFEGMSWFTEFEIEKFYEALRFLEIPVTVYPGPYYYKPPKKTPKYKPLSEFKWGHNPIEYGFKPWMRLDNNDLKFILQPEYVAHSIDLVDVEDYYGVMVTHLPTGIISFNIERGSYDYSTKECLKELKEKIKNES